MVQGDPSSLTFFTLLSEEHLIIERCELCQESPHNCCDTSGEDDGHRFLFPHCQSDPEAKLDVLIQKFLDTSSSSLVLTLTIIFPSFSISFHSGWPALNRTGWILPQYPFLPFIPARCPYLIADQNFHFHFWMFLLFVFTFFSSAILCPAKPRKKKQYHEKWNHANY